MCTVFTNDATYLSARDDLLAVRIFLFRKLLITNSKPKPFSSKKSERDLMAISELLSMFSMIQSPKSLDTF